MPVTRYSTAHGRPHKSKKELAERIDAKLRELRLHAGHDEFDPVLMMAIIGAEAYDTGDHAMALVAFKEVSQYVRPKLATVAVEHKDEPPIPSKARVMGALARMGVKVEATREDALNLVRDMMDREGISYEEAVQAVEDETGVSLSDVPQLLPPGDPRYE